jgi:hypothetical protein
LGKETITLYASTVPLGDLEVTPTGSFFKVKGSAAEIEVKVRSTKTRGATRTPDATPIELAKTSVTILITQ